MRRVTRTLKTEALESIELAVEFFNRPKKTGRTKSVLYFLQQSFEMLLKAAIYERRGTITAPGERETHKFGRCIGIALSDLGLIDEDAARTLRNLSGQRDAATHYFTTLSEQALYLYTQSALTLFAMVLEKTFGEQLGTYLPHRVLPVSTYPPLDLALFLDDEFTQIRALLRPGKRRTTEAYAHLRSFAVLESNVDGEGQQPTDSELSRLAKQLQKGEDWRSIFPGVAALRLETTGTGLAYNLRIVKNNQSGVPVHLANSSDDAATVVLKETNLLDRYPLIQKSLIDKLDRSQGQIRALIWHFKIKEELAFYREFTHHSCRIQGYSLGALAHLDRELQALSPEEVQQICERYREHERARRSRTSKQDPVPMKLVEAHT